MRIQSCLPLLCLVACGEVTVVAPDPEADYIAAFNANRDLAAEAAALPLASAFEVPLSGAATYEGTAALVMDSNAFTSRVDDTSLIGDVTLTADFARDDLSGRAEDFVGIVDGQEVAYYDGSLRIHSGDLRVLRASQFGAQVDGTLFDRDDTVTVDGSIIGNFRSELFRDVSHLTAISSGGTDFTHNGQDHPGLLSIVAER